MQFSNNATLAMNIFISTPPCDSLILMIYTS